VPSDPHHSAEAMLSSLPVLSNGFSPFHPEIHTQLAYGKIPARHRYELFFERYRSAAEIVTADLKARGMHRTKIRVLDVGCGEGFFKFFLTDVAAEWHGIEIWKDRAEYCERLGYQVHRLDMEQDDLPWSDGHFDVVLASHVIEHIHNVPRVLGQMQRVLKPDGLLLVATPTKPPLVASLMNWIYKLREKDVGETQNAFSARSLQKTVLGHVGWPTSSVIDVRGFRLFSARKRLPLEDWRWFYQASQFIGQHCLWVVPEVNVILRKPTSGSHSANRIHGAARQAA
jgi:SAM-dependent methyltransferase